jgi:branched-chain amino acid transport system substrate-binding protein
VQTVPSVDQTFGGLFSASSPAPSRTEPAKATGSPPPWAQ